MHSRVYLGRGCYNSPLLKRNFVPKILVSEMLIDEDSPPHLLSVSLVWYNFQVVTRPLNHSTKHVLLSSHLEYSLLLPGIFLIPMSFPWDSCHSLLHKASCPTISTWSTQVMILSVPDPLSCPMRSLSIFPSFFLTVIKNLTLAYLQKSNLYFVFRHLWLPLNSINSNQLATSLKFISLISVSTYNISHLAYFSLNPRLNIVKIRVYTCYINV